MSMDCAHADSWLPDYRVASNFDTTKWSYARIGWELMRRGAEYQKACLRILESRKRGEAAEFEGPLWGLAQVIPFWKSWDTIERRFVVRLYPHSHKNLKSELARVPRKQGGLESRRMLRVVVDLGLAVGDTRVLDIQLRRLARLLQVRLKVHAAERDCRVRRNPRIDKVVVGRYLKLLDLDAHQSPMPARRIGLLLYGKKLPSKVLSKRLNKDRKEARRLSEYGYVKFLVRARQEQKRRSEEL